jgi:hypothetical protein
VFVRGKAKHDQDTVRHSQADFEARFIQRSVKRGMSDIQARRFEAYDAEGLRGLAQKLVTRSAKKQASRAKA